MERASDSTRKLRIVRTASGEDAPPDATSHDDEPEGAPTARVATVTMDDRARRSSPPPAVAVTPVVEVVTHGPRRLPSRAATKTHGVTAPPEEPQPPHAMPELAPPPSVPPRPRELPRVRAPRGEPEWSVKPTEMDLPKVGDFIPQDELISTRAPTPRLLPRAPEPRASIITRGSLALLALLAIVLLLGVVLGLGR